MQDVSQTNAGLNYENLSMRSEGWDYRRFDVQTWLQRTANGTLKDTHFGRTSNEQAPHPGLFTDPLLRSIYLIDIALFIASEKVSYLATAGLLRLAPDEASQVYTATQVMDEARHYEVFCRRFADFGYTPEQRNKVVSDYVTPALRNFHDLILEQIDKKDYVAGTVAQNIIMEGMAYPVYRYEYKYWSRFDPSLSKIIRGAFADEAHHVSFGEIVIARAIEGRGNQNRNHIRNLLGDFEKLMTEVFEGVIRHYIGMYQACANEYVSLVGDIEIFPGHRLADLTEEEQVRTLLEEIKREHQMRLARIGVT